MCHKYCVFDSLIFKGYITDEPQFACGEVDPLPPINNDNITGWAALVKYSTNYTKNCDCRYEDKVCLHNLTCPIYQSGHT